MVRTPSVQRDLRWLGPKDSRWLLKEAALRLRNDPTVQTQNLKALRENSVAERELRLRGKYRVLFNVDLQRREITLVVVGLKRGEALYVRGKRFADHRSY